MKEQGIAVAIQDIILFYKCECPRVFYDIRKVTKILLVIILDIYIKCEG